MATSGVHQRLKALVDKRFSGRPTDLEEKCGLGTGVVVKWLQRKLKRVPNGQALMKMAEHADVSPTWLLTGEGPELASSSRTDSTLAQDLRAEIHARVSDRDELAAGFIPAAEELFETVLAEFCPRLQRDGRRMAEETARLAREWDQGIRFAEQHEKALRELIRTNPRPL